MATTFFDTNILIYARDKDGGRKHDIARDLVKRRFGDGSARVSTQVLQEYYWIATRKLGVSPVSARRDVQFFGQGDLIRVDLECILQAIDLTRLYSLSFWDALILSASSVGGCAVVLTEALQHDQRIQNLHVVNPFLT
jgi:predicted nucleic acid-binding protein